MTTDSTLTEAQRIKAKLLARWEGEGGALSAGGASTVETLDEADMRVLCRLGAALLDEWSTLSTECRATVVERAATLHAATDTARIKAHVARFMQDHQEP